MTTNPMFHAATSKPVISLHDLRVSYGEREILHGISFDVQPGETLVILGGSGSGKSTLLRTLVGLEKPSAGEIWIKGRDIAKTSTAEMDAIRRKIGMSCMKKRAAVARALAMDPEILFFDEPSAGLDPIIAAGIDQLILELKRAFRMTIIVVTHELASAFLIADRMLLIDKGNIVALGTVQEMRASTQPRVRQFLDRVAEPEIAGEMDYLQMLTAERHEPQSSAGKRGK